jgi:Ca2+-binding EF-hand superfamily protein
MPTLQAVRELISMGDVSVETVADHFARFVNEDGSLDPASFNAGFRRFVNKSGDISQVRAVLTKLFQLFDTNGDGAVDFAELMAGVSVLCGGTRDQKVETAFSLFGEW